MSDTTDDDLNPQFTVFPECSECGVAYVYRRGISLSRGCLWVWQRDCKHKKAEAVIHGAPEEVGR